MGMESFNAEPVVPDESERVDDVGKARVMAEAGDNRREEAVRARAEEAEAGGLVRKFATPDSISADEMAERKEDAAGVMYDRSKEIK